MSQLMGWILEVDTMPLGSTLTVDAAAGATTLAVWDAFDFEPSGGTLSLNDALLAYTAADPDTDTITLAAPLAVAALEADQVIAWDIDNNAPKVETTALVEVENVGDEDDPVPCSVAHSLIPMLPSGSRGGRGETVVVDDEGGRWRVVDVFAKEAQVDGAVIDPRSTVPPEALTDGVAPAASPDPVVRQGIGTLFVLWEPIANPDPVMYDVHVSTTTFTPSPTTLVGSGIGSGPVVVRTLTDGTKLSPGTTYFIRVVARDADGEAPPSSEVQGTPVAALAEEIATGAITTTKVADDAITTPKILAGAVTADKIQANSIGAGQIAADAITADELAANAVTAEKIQAQAIDGMTITGAHIRSAASGKRWEMDSVNHNQLRGYSGVPGEVGPGYLLVDDTSSSGGGGTPTVVLTPPYLVAGDVAAALELFHDAVGHSEADLQANDASLTGVWSEFPAWNQMRALAWADASGSHLEVANVGAGLAVGMGLHSDTGWGVDVGDTSLDLDNTGAMTADVAKMDVTIDTERALVAREVGAIAAVAGPANAPFSSRTSSATASISNNLFTAISYGSIVTERKISVSGSTITVDVPGLYDIHATTSFASNATGQRHIRFLRNGAEIARGSEAAWTGIGTRIEVQRKVELAAGDTIVVEVFQNSGAALTVHATGLGVHTFDMTWLGWGGLAPA